MFKGKKKKTSYLCMTDSINVEKTRDLLLYVCQFVSVFLLYIFVRKTKNRVNVHYVVNYINVVNAFFKISSVYF